KYRLYAKEMMDNEALSAALQSKELVLVIVAADAAVHILSIQQEHKTYDTYKAENEKMFLHTLRSDWGTDIDMTKPLKFNPEINHRAGQREENMRFASPYRNPAERAIEHKLNLPVNLNFKDTPLCDAIETLRLQTGVNIVPQ